jgi:hypothetical protein
MAKVIYVDSPLTPQAAMLLKLVAPRLDDRQLSDFVKKTSQQQQQPEEEPKQEDAADTDDDVESDWDEFMESEDNEEVNFDPFREFESCPHFVTLKEDYGREVILVKISLQF